MMNLRPRLSSGRWLLLLACGSAAVLVAGMVGVVTHAERRQSRVGTAVVTTTTSTSAGSTGDPTPSTSTPLIETTQPTPPGTAGRPGPTTTAGVPGGAGLVVTNGGIVLPVVGAAAGGGVVVETPCAAMVTLSAAQAHEVPAVQVVIDPGHGGDEPGAIGPGGLTEKALNLAVAQQTMDALVRAGVGVVLTRSADYRIAIGVRTAIAKAAAPKVFVSIHHNAAPEGTLPGPGTATFYQVASGASKRLSGLIFEEVDRALVTTYPGVAWVGDSDAGAKVRLSSSGNDYYGIVRGSQGVTGVLAELAYISNPPEEAFLATAAGQRVEGEAVARGILRYLTTPDPGSGFVTPHPRTSPAGSGGGTVGCKDPPLTGRLTRARRAVPVLEAVYGPCAHKVLPKRGRVGRG